MQRIERESINSRFDSKRVLRMESTSPIEALNANEIEIKRCTIISCCRQEDDKQVEHFHSTLTRQPSHRTRARLCDGKQFKEQQLLLFGRRGAKRH